MTNNKNSRDETKIENTKQQENSLINKGTKIMGKVVFSSYLGLPGMVVWEGFKYICNQYPETVNHAKQSIYNFFVNTDGKIKVNNVLLTTGAFVITIGTYMIVTGDSGLPTRNIIKPPLKKLGKEIGTALVPIAINETEKVVTTIVPEIGKQVSTYLFVEPGSPDELINQIVRDFLASQK